MIPHQTITALPATLHHALLAVPPCDYHLDHRFQLLLDAGLALAEGFFLRLVAGRFDLEAGTGGLSWLWLGRHRNILSAS